MKVMDEKGRVFGLINIVDLIILLVVVLAAAGAAYKFTHKSLQGKSVTVEFQVMIPHLRPELAQAIKVGDRMVQGSSYTGVTVKDVQIKPGYSVNVDARGQRVESYDPFLKDVYVTNTGTTVLSSASITMGGQEVRVGKDYYVKSRDYEFKGTVVKVEVKE
ncbi:MAG: DUF4330 domain-containing protein [Peptococcaceae bacterium]|nr:DUF4330 domain-containing protein [Peptococcaceae bacterium]